MGGGTKKEEPYCDGINCLGEIQLFIFLVVVFHFTMNPILGCKITKT